MPIGQSVSVRIISIHSAARAETIICFYHLAFTQNFNPLRREGGDVQYTKEGDKTQHFNPLRREGGDIDL